MHPSSQSRRTFLQVSAATAAAAPLLSMPGRVLARPNHFDPSFGTATEAMCALETRQISSRELTAHVFARIRKHNPSLNCFITLLEEQATRSAAAADEARARGGRLGPLHGLPVLMKDVFLTAGVRTTTGSLQYKDFVPSEDAVSVARMKRAGAIIVGKTSSPLDARDWQTFNDIIGQTNNPWDLTRTPGGSTGGGAAALATGLGFLETGSDMAGSIRTPSHFCGVYGHKPSFDLVPHIGHLPPPPGVQWTNPLAVSGPLARSADDLALSLGVIGGPLEEALTLRLPRPRKTSLRDYRIGYVVDDPFAPVDSGLKEVLVGAIDALRSAGATLVEGWPEGVTFSEYYESFWFHSGAVYGTSALPPDQVPRLRELVAQGVVQDPVLKGIFATHAEYAQRDSQRLAHRARWKAYFSKFDAFLLPPHVLPAFPHDHAMPLPSRTLMTERGPVPYLDNTKWISIATLAGNPATMAPVGRTKSGLPVGMQIIGPWYEDLTPIDIARRLTELVGGFEPPPAYVD